MRKLCYSVILLAALAAVVAIEIRTSFIQSRLFFGLAEKLSFNVEDGASRSVRFPDSGPYNLQQGYALVDDFTGQLQRQGFAIARQGVFSPELIRYVELGGNPPFREKLQSGLTIVDEQGTPLYRARYPAHIYRTFAEIPPVLVDTLLFIENRELLENRHPRLNPAIEWDRLAEAVAAQAGKLLEPGLDTPGGSTLATQMEKFRYSPGGRTTDVREKLRQIVSASIRAYQDGQLTFEARERIVRDYLNATPLAARAGHGEIHGIGDGLWIWYGIDFARANELLGDPGAPVAERARVYKAALSLLLSQRRPSHYLASARTELDTLTDSYLRLMARAGVIDQATAIAALAQPLAFRDSITLPALSAFSDRKAITHVRTSLLAMLGVQELYTLDRLDLTVTTTVANEVQQQVATVLDNLANTDFARAQGLIGPKLLREDQLDAVRYSVLLYESTDNGNVLRVQADNLDLPFDLNVGSKLDLGSTAKLRTLISYLDVVETLYRRHAQKSPEELQPVMASGDVLSQWVAGYLSEHPFASLQDILAAAMQRTYSASPAERFFTAGGLHRFGNFEKKDNYRTMTVAEAFNRSVNLVFIRLIRDIARFHTAEIPGSRELLANPGDPRRSAYLQRFADQEGSDFLIGFYNRYHGLAPDQQLQKLAERTRATGYRLAMAFRTVRPAASLDEMAAFIALRLGDDMPSAYELAQLYDKYDPARFNSNDRAYLAGLHPLELWLLWYLQEKPQAGLSEVLAASRDERQQAYAWLFKPGRTKAQNKRIGILLEQDAFAAIHRQWQRLGYPFSSLVPSYATAVGASADRPIALAELMGIVLNDGVRKPMRQIDSLVFAENTPYETVFRARADSPNIVLSPQICLTVREALAAIVESGTARRLRGAFPGSGEAPLVVGGKTGTGDHRLKQFAAGGRLLSDEVVNRNAVFTFYIGDRHFGVILAHVGGEKASNFDFTSGLAAQILKALQPALDPLIRADQARYAARD